MTDPNLAKGRTSACHAYWIRPTASRWVRLSQFRVALVSGGVRLDPGRSGEIWGRGSWVWS